MTTSDQVSTQPISAAQPVRPNRGRSVAAVICLVLAAVLTTPAAVAFWGHRTLTDTQRYVDTVGPLIESPEVQDVLATAVVDAISRQVDVETVITEAFSGVIDDRPRLQALIGPLSSAVEGLIEREVRAFIGSDAFADFWVAANTRAQQVFLRLLQGDETGAISLQGEQVVLDLSVVIDQVKARLVARGLTFVENVPIPDVDKQIVLLEAPQLAQLRNIYAFANPIATWALPVVALLYVAAFALARRRARMVVVIGVILSANALLMAFALSVGKQLFVNELTGTVFGPATSVFFSTLVAYLSRGLRVFFWLGVALVVAGWFAGGSGTRLRSATATSLHRLGAAAAGSAGGLARAGQWVAPNAGWLRYVALLVGAVTLLWGFDTSPERLAWCCLLVLGLLVVIEVLVGAASPRDKKASGAATPVAVPGGGI